MDFPGGLLLIIGSGSVVTFGSTETFGFELTFTGLVFGGSGRGSSF